MKLTIRNPRCEGLYKDIHDLAVHCWLDRSWIPEILYGLGRAVERVRITGGIPYPQYPSDRYGELCITDDAIIYTTETQKGRYIYTPSEFTFKGYRGSFRGGSALGGWSVVADGNKLVRVDVDFCSPVGPGVFGEIYVDGSDGSSYDLVTSAPDIQFWE